MGLGTRFLKEEMRALCPSLSHENMASTSQEETSHQYPTILSPRFWTSSLQNYEKIHFCCLRQKKKKKIFFLNYPGVYR